MYLFLCFLTLLLLVIYHQLRKPHRFPPGPFSLPMVGSFPTLLLFFMKKDRKFQDVFLAVGKAYGPVTGIYMGSQRTVLLNGYETCKEALARDDMAYRSDVLPPTCAFIKKKAGIFFIDGPLWKEQRRFTLRHLRDFGFGRRSMESVIQEEVNLLFDGIESEMSNNPEQKLIGLELSHLFPVVAVNTLWAIMSDTRYNLKDEKFKSITKLVIEFFRTGDVINPVNFSSMLQKIPFVNANYKKQVNLVKQITYFIEETIDQHWETFDENNLRDFIDVYIKEMKEHKNDANPTFNKSQLTVVCLDLFTAGTETTSSTIAFCVRYMIKYPHIQDKMREELLRVIGTERLPSIDDLKNLPYCQAVLTEVLRISGLVSGTPPHYTRSNVEFQGYKIPKDTSIMINLWSVHMDPKIWGDPETFRPERFIGSDGTFQKDEHLMLFGHGPRTCLGEPLARYTTILFFTSLIQRYKFDVPSMGQPPSDEVLSGFTQGPARYKVAVTRV